MPYSVKTAGAGSDYIGDTRSHQFKIWVTESPRDSMFYEDGGQTFLRTDEDGMAVGNTLDIVCQTCHISWSTEFLFPYAENIHQEGLKVNPEPQGGIPHDYTLKQNYPNPFNASTTVEFSLPRGGFSELSLFNTAGKKVKTVVSEELAAGNYTIPIHLPDLPSGVYFYRLTSNSFSRSKKLVLVK